MHSKWQRDLYMTHSYSEEEYLEDLGRSICDNSRIMFLISP